VLRSFRVANHRSIRDEQELILLPAYHDTDSVVPVVAIYGANASGKSNLLDALHFMAQAVRDSFGRWSPEGGVPRRPFKLDPQAAAEPSTFVVELLIQGVRYTYGFVVDDRHVLEEWLYSYPEKRKRVLFERAGDEIKVGTTVPDLRAKLEVLEGLTRSNALFLSLAAQSNVEQLMPVHACFARSLGFRSQSSELDMVRVADFLQSSPDNRARLVELVRVADVGVSDLVLEDDADMQERVELLADYVKRRARRSRRQIRFVHTLGGELFKIDDESDGTKSWLRLLPVVLAALDGGKVLVIDEVDTSLHPKLTAQLARLFQDPETNPNHAQLIFTTHDTSLLGTMLGEEVLKRDQVWFVEKDQEGASKLYPLTDFHPRKGENTERRYLGGSYGAVPIFSDTDFADAVRGHDVLPDGSVD
jgi:uncharacterized protein